MNSLSKLALALASGVFFVARAPAQVTEAWATAIPIGPGTPIKVNVGPAGSLHLFGWGGTSDSAVAALDLNGGVRWTNRFDGDPTTLNSPVDQIVDPAGHVYVVCNENNVAPLLPQIVLLKYTSDGILLWTSLLPATNAYATQLALDSQGRILVAGSTLSPVNDADFLTVRCDTNGAALWTAHYTGSPQSSDWAPHMAVDGADNVYVAGLSVGADPDTDFALVKYNSNGQQVWVTRGKGLEYPVAIQADTAGNTWVSGYSFKDPLHPQVARMVVMRYAASGQLLWTAHYSRAPGESVETIASALDDVGNLWVAGATYGDAEDVVLLKLDAAGNRQWAARYNGARNGSDHPSGLALDTFGNAYITGDAQEGSNSDPSYFTLKFGPSGSRLWNISRPSDSSYYNYPAGVGLDAGGGVYIAGRYYNNYDDSGWLAVKYVENPAPGVPMVLPLPASQVVQPGGIATFTVAATGDGPLSYQWRYNGRPISRATNATLTLENVRLEQRGGYSADVRNAVGTAATSETELIVMVPPTITRQPASQIAFRGTDVSFSVAATGLEPFNYQWQSDGTNLAGATDAALTLFNVQPADARGYSVIVANGAGSITSQTAILTVSMQVTRSWSASYDGPVRGAELSPLLALDGAGLPVLTAASQAVDTDFDFATLKHDLAGARLWTSRFNSASNAADFPAGLFVDGSGNVYVTGTSSADLTLPSVVTVKYDAGGNPVWTAQATNHEWPNVVTADAAGNAYVASRLDGDVVTRKYDVNGNVAWTAQYGDSYNEQPCAIALDPSGNVCVGIRQFNSYNTDFLLVKYGPDGAELWRARYDGDEGDDSGGVDTLLGMGLDTAGNIYLAGEVFDRSAGVMGSALAVVKFGGDGSQLWVVRHRFPLQRRAVPVAFTVNAAGYSWLAFVSEIPEVTGGAGAATMGAGVEPESAFHAVAQFSPDGHERWVAILSPSEEGAIRGLAADNAGKSYVTSTLFQDSSGADIGTSQMDPNGNLLWTALYNGPANGQDNGNAIAVGPTGDIFVAGTSGDAFGNPDVVLLKYRENIVPGLPAITSPPMDVLTRVNSNATFTVTATGAVPLRYQWLFNGTPLPGATNASLAIRNVGYEGKEDVGFYAVEVSNPAGTARSPAARLETLAPPVIVTEPQTQMSVLGSSVAFSVVVVGNEPLGYQWLFNGTPIPGTTNATLEFENLQPAQAGNYSVVVSDAAGTILSQSAALTVSRLARVCGSVHHGTNAHFLVIDGAGGSYSAGGEGVTRRDAQGQTLWTTPFAAIPTALALGSNGTVYVTGASSGTSNTMLTVKYDMNGSVVWSRPDNLVPTLSPPAGAAAILQEDTSGNLVVLVRAYGAFTDLLTVKYAPNGNRLWAVTYPSGAADYPNDLALDSAGNIYVAGSVGFAGIAIKYSPNGARLWATQFNEVYLGGISVEVDAADNAYVAVSAPDPGGPNPDYYNLLTLKFAPNGSPLWSARFNQSFGSGYSGLLLVVDPAGNAYISGDGATVKYSASGQLLWVARPPVIGPRGLAVDAAGNLLVSGIWASIVKYDTLGNQRWLADPAGIFFNGPITPVVAGVPGEVFVSTITYDAGALVTRYCEQSVPGAPEILATPQDQTIIAGQTATFTVTGTGSSPLHYRWRYGGQVISGVDAPTLVFTNTPPWQAGAYSVEVINALGSVLSPEATLTVYRPPMFIVRPTDQCVVAGTSARFEVEAEGDRPIQFQWSFNGLLLPGETNRTLLLTNIQARDVGVYSARAGNPYGQATASAALTLVPNVQQAWGRSFNNSNATYGVPNMDDRLTASTIDSAGNIYVTGVSEGPTLNQPQDILTQKYDAAGTLLWSARHEVPNPAYRNPTAIALDSAGDAYVALQDYGSMPSPPFALKYSPQGQLLREFRPAAPGPVSATTVVVDAQDNVYFSGALFQTEKYSPAGTLVWSNSIPGSDTVHDMVVDSAGNVFVAGAELTDVINGEGIEDFLTAKFSPTGALLWSRRYAAADQIHDEARKIALDTAGNVYVAGRSTVGFYPYSYPNYRRDFALVKYDTDGNQLWAMTQGAADVDDFLSDLKLDSAGNPVLLGLSADFSGIGENFSIAKFSPAGAVLWEQHVFSRPAPPGYSAPVALALDAADNLYATGTAYNDQFANILVTVKLDSAGQVLWWARFDDGVPDGGHDFATDIHVDTANRVIVTGSAGGYARDFVVLQYTQPASPDAPVILSQPQDVTVPFRGMAQFSVTASNAFRYQWSLNNRDLPGATNATLIIPAADWNHEGRYAVRVENDTYCVVSRAAQLTLRVPVPIMAGQGFSDEGYFYCFAVVTPGRSYRIEASTDLVNWATVSVETAYGRTISFYDSASPWQSWRFYRVVEGE